MRNYGIESWLGSELAVLWIAMAEAGDDGGKSYLISSRQHPAD